MARKRSPTLTDGEARLMTVLWERSSATVAAIVSALEPQGPVNYSTVQTLLRILEKKGYIAHHKSGRAFIYSPVVDQQQARRHALRHLLTRLFNGSPSLLVLNVLEHETIAPDELKRLQQLLGQSE
ncbi:MAG: BlaI/MecI/CopY family transcriptional regulator [Vicinamibacterales bacterium]